VEFLIPIPVSFVLALLWASYRTHRPRRKTPIVTAEDYRRALDALAPHEPGGSGTERRHLARRGR
jgi:hypothetical protein